MPSLRHRTLATSLIAGTVLLVGTTPAMPLTAPVVTPLGAPPRALISADVDADGRQDLVISRFSDALGFRADATVLRGDGTGRFSEGPSFAGTVDPFAIALDRIDGDHVADLVMTARDRFGLARGTASGAFGAVATFGARNADLGGGGIVIGDFNGDGHRDVAGSGAVELGDGTGRFSRVAGPGIPADSLRQLTVGDFDRDLRQDVAFVNTVGPGVIVQRGRGDGTFGPARVVYPAPQPFALASADLDGDLDQDLVAANAGAPNSLTVLLSDGRGGFAAQPEVPVGGSGIPSDAAVADIDGDGALDVVIAVSNAGFGALSVRFGDGAGGFPTEQVTNFPADMPNQLTVGDFDGDARCDIAVGMLGPAGIHVFAGTGAAAPAGHEPCRDRVSDPVGSMGARLLSGPVRTTPGAALTARVSLSRPGVVAMAFSRTPGSTTRGRRVPMGAGRHTLRLRAPRTPGRFVLTLSAGSLEGSVVRRHIRAVVKAK